MLRSKNFWALGLALALGLTLEVGSASADIQTYDLNVANSALTGFTGPFVEVTVNQTGANTATLTYTALTNGGYTYLLTDGGAVAANINSGTGTIGISGLSYTVPSTGGPWSPSLAVQNPPGTDNDDGWGLFNVRITTGSAGFSSAQSITFTVTVTGAGAPTWASAADVLTGNDHLPNPEILAAHVDPWTGSGAPISTTSFASDAQVQVVPEPSTLALVGLGALGFVGYGIRRRKAVVA